MANPIWELFVRLTADAKPFQSGMDAAERATEKAARKWRALGDEMVSLGTKMTAAVTLPLTAIGAYSVKTAADFDSLKRGLIAVSGGADEAEKQLVRLREVAKLPGLGFQDAVQGAIRLQAAGLSAATSEKALKAFGNALATVGKGKAELDGVTTALTQIANKSKVSAEEINQLAERIPQIRQVMINIFGTADTEMIQKAGVAPKQFIELIIAELEKIPPVSAGINNDFENLQDTLQQTADKVGKALIPAIKSMLPAVEGVITKVGELAEGFSRLDPTTKTFIGALVTAFAVSGPVIIGIGITLKSVGDLATAIWGANAAGRALALTMKAVPWLVIASSIATVGIAYKDWRDQEQKVTDLQAEGSLLLKDREIRLRRLGVEFGGLTKEYNSGAISAEQYLKELGKLGDGLTKTAAAAKTVPPPLITLKQTLDEFKPLNFDKDSLQLAQLARDVNTAQTAMLDWGNELQQGVLQTSLDELFTTIDALKNPGKDLAVWIGEAGDAAIKAAADAAKLEEGLRTLNDVSGGTSEQFSKILRQGWSEHIKVAAKGTSELGREVKKAYDNMRRGIAEAIVEWKGFGQTALNIVKELAKGIIEILVGQALKQLAKSLSGILGQLGGIGKALGGLLGGGASAAGSAAGGGASSAGGGASGAAGGAASGLTGTVTMISGIVTAVSSVIGNFQMAGMNKSLDLIENYTRYTKIYTGEQGDSILETLHLIRNSWTNYMSWTWDVHTVYLQKICAAVEGTGTGAANGSGGARGSFVFNNCVFGSGTTQATINAMMTAAFSQYAAAVGR